ncbi:MAG TPA: hypothetical protein V6D35_09365 [Candidatus Sericytochromatia bacterium]
MNKQQVVVAEFEKTELALKLAQNSFEEARSQHQEATKNVELKWKLTGAGLTHGHYIL